MVAPAGVDAGSGDRHQEEFSVGIFYSTFDEDPNITMLVGGTAEEFCLDNPDDPFSAEPRSATARVRVRKNGVVKISVDDTGQPFHLYESGG